MPIYITKIKCLNYVKENHQLNKNIVMSFIAWELSKRVSRCIGVFVCVCVCCLNLYFLINFFTSLFLPSIYSILEIAGFSKGGCVQSCLMPVPMPSGYTDPVPCCFYTVKYSVNWTASKVLWDETYITCSSSGPRA